MAAPEKVTPQTLGELKQRGQKITALTAYDYPMARLMDKAGVDVILVGDSLGMVVLGYDSTLPVTVDDVIHHCRAVRRAVQRALVVADMPFGSYQTSTDQAVENAIRLIKEGGAEAVKLEGGVTWAATIERIQRAGIPVMGHIGLLPQSVLLSGGYKVQGREIDDIERLLQDADAVQEAGAFSIVLEGIPAPVAKLITRRVTIPTIGIGAGVDCDGQILVVHDLLGLILNHKPKFVRTYAHLREEMESAFGRFIEDVHRGDFPSPEESYTLTDDVKRLLEERYGGHSHD